MNTTRSIPAVTKFPTEIIDGLEYPRTPAGLALWRQDPFVQADENKDRIRVFNRQNRCHYFLERHSGEAAAENLVVCSIRSAGRFGDAYTPDHHANLMRAGKDADPLRVRLLHTGADSARVEDARGIQHTVAPENLWHVMAVRAGADGATARAA